MLYKPRRFVGRVRDAAGRYSAEENSIHILSIHANGEKKT